MTACRNLKEILKEISADAEQIEEECVQAVIQLILESNRIFVAGAGRSGFAASAFANRLMHLGFDVHFVGEPTTPSIRKGDLLIIGSGSGKTKGMVSKAETAVKEGASIATITIHPEGDVAQMANAVIVIPGSSMRNHANEDPLKKAPTIQPGGSSFEQLTWLVYDSMIVDLKAAKEQTQEDMNYRHSNLE